MTKPILLIATLIGPVLLAWVVSGSVCGFYTPREINCFHASDGYWEVFFSFAIMFCIATWVPALLFYLIARSRKGDTS